MEKLESLCVFTPYGYTFTFRDVELIHDNETGIRFRYSAMSDGLNKEANFYRHQIVGVSKRRRVGATRADQRTVLET
jgi:hypothetical protein